MPVHGAGIIVAQNIVESKTNFAACAFDESIVILEAERSGDRHPAVRARVL
jgi:hypothetical protein